MIHTHLVLIIPSSVVTVIRGRPRSPLHTHDGEIESGPCREKIYAPLKAVSFSSFTILRSSDILNCLLVSRNVW
jgi:hypothetical protein